MSDKLSKIINVENIDVPGLVKVLEGIEERLCDIEELLKIDRTVGDEQGIPLADALDIARAWRDGKMIGGDEDAVRNALLYEVESLHRVLLFNTGDRCVDATAEDSAGPIFRVAEDEKDRPTGVYSEIADIKERLEELEKIINMYWAPKYKTDKVTARES